MLALHVKENNIKFNLSKLLGVLLQMYVCKTKDKKGGPSYA